MRAGFVVRVRINPTDCQSILDLMESGGVNIEGMSFSSITSLAVASMLAALRKQEAIPEPDPFLYDRRMAQYAGGKSTYNKRTLTEAIYVGQAKGLSPPEIQMPKTGVDIPPEIQSADGLELVNLYHALKTANTPHDKLRLRQVEAELDRRNGR